MREFFLWLFSQNNSSASIDLFDPWHFLYLAIIFGGSVTAAILLRKKPERIRERALRVMAYLTVGLYVADFFIMPLSDSYQGISVYKLPFNICTIMAVLAPVVQFSPRARKLRPQVVVLSVASSLMWMCYPGSALGGQPPFCYLIFQTFMYHGFLFSWGFLNLALGAVVPDIRQIWKELVGIGLILIWADFGNAVYGRDMNWFFIETSIFPFLPDAVMPVAVVLAVFAVCLVVHGACWAVRTLAVRRSAAAAVTCV